MTAPIGAKKVHVMAGFATGDDAQATFIDNPGYAAETAAGAGLSILIEPLNRHDAPGYFLQTTRHVQNIIDDLSLENVRLMFDCYHVGRTEGDVLTRLTDLHPIIGHIQIAAVPDRGAPGHGEPDYSTVYAKLKDPGWTSPVGAECKPNGQVTSDTLGWLANAKAY